MKALFEKVTFGEQSSLLVRRFRLPYFDAPWHYHPEYELTYIVKGFGRRFVGDHIEPFEAGDLVLIGPDLPHFWRSDDQFYQSDPGLEVESIVIQFPTALDHKVLASIPEAVATQQLLQWARYGLRFSQVARDAAAPKLEHLIGCAGLPQLLGLLTILDLLATDRDAYLLASEGYQLAPSAAETERMKRILEFMLTHFREEIRMEQAASLAGMAPAAFCRYFKNRTRKTFIEYLNELRIGHARSLLTTSNLSIGQVGLEAGFNNISHFHQHFKRQTGVTPLRYQSMTRKGL